jgi:hypothetical protein
VLKSSESLRRNWASGGKTPLPAHVTIFFAVFGRKSAAGQPASALAGLEAALRFIDDVDAPLAAHEPVVPVAAAKRFQ